MTDYKIEIVGKCRYADTRVDDVDLRIVHDYKFNNEIRIYAQSDDGEIHLVMDPQACAELLLQLQLCLLRSIKGDPKNV